jgi:hypothetical protein
MPTLRDLLYRFRRGLVPPGPALTRVPPPVDRHVLAEAELAATFEVIDHSTAELERQTEIATRNADEVAAAARAEADDLLRRTDRQLGQIRAEAVTARRAELAGERAAIEASATDECARIEEQAAHRLPALVDRVVDMVVAGGR